MINATEGTGVCLVSLDQAIKEVIASKQAANRRPMYVRQLRYYLEMFARGRGGEPICSITGDDLRQWFDQRKDKPATRKTGQVLLNVLFSHAQRTGRVTINPCAQLERVSVDRETPKIFTPAEVRRMLRFARRKMPWRLPQLVLSVYAGIRPTELSRLRWADIDLDRGFVRIDAAASKTRRRRIVPLDPKAIKWLRACRRRDDKPIGCAPATAKWRQSLERNCGIVWSQDICRHSAASYLLAKHQDVGKISRWLGNSPSVLISYYIDLVDPDDCRRFWKI